MNRKEPGTGAILFALPREAYSVIGPEGWSGVDDLKIKRSTFSLSSRGPVFDSYIFGPGRQGAMRMGSFFEDSPPAWILLLGVSGALAPGIETGALVVPDAIIHTSGFASGISDTPVEKISLDRKLVNLLHSRCQGKSALVSGHLLTVDSPLCSPSEKSRAFHSTKAVAVDMESYFLAQIAQRLDIPFLVVRAVSDRADQAIPKPVAHCLKGDGTIDPLKMAKALLSKPQAISHLLSLGLGFKRACSSLRYALRLGVTAISKAQRSRRS